MQSQRSYMLALVLFSGLMTFGLSSLAEDHSQFCYQEGRDSALQNLIVEVATAQHRERDGIDTWICEYAAGGMGIEVRNSLWSGGPWAQRLSNFWKTGAFQNLGEARFELSCFIDRVKLVESSDELHVVDMKLEDLELQEIPRKDYRGSVHFVVEKIPGHKTFDEVDAVNRELHEASAMERIGIVFNTIDSLEQAKFEDSYLIRVKLVGDDLITPLEQGKDKKLHLIDITDFRK